MRVRLILLLGSIAVSTTAAAQPAPGEAWHVVPSLWLGLEHFHYAELSPVVDANGKQPTLDKHLAVLPTARVEAEVTSPRRRLFARGSVGWTSGSMTYEGGIEQLATGTITPFSGPTTGYMLDVDLVAGARGHVGRYAMLGGFLGIGHHDWKRDLRGLEAGYLEQYAWSYEQLGARLDVAPCARVEISFEATVLVPNTGSLAITHQQNGLDDDHLGLGFGPGGRLRLAGAYAVTPRVQVTAVAGFEADNIANSTAVPATIHGQPIMDPNGNTLYLTEPYSDTYRTTFAVGGAYVF